MNINRIMSRHVVPVVFGCIAYEWIGSIGWAVFVLGALTAYSFLTEPRPKQTPDKHLLKE